MYFFLAIALARDLVGPKIIIIVRLNTSVMLEPNVLETFPCYGCGVVPAFPPPTLPRVNDPCWRMDPHTVPMLADGARCYTHVAG